MFSINAYYTDCWVKNRYKFNKNTENKNFKFDREIQHIMFNVVIITLSH